MTTSGTAPPPCSPPSACSTAPSSAAACSATATSNSSAFSTLSSARLPRTSRSTSSSTTTPPTNIPKACPREGGGAGLAGTPSALDFSLHPNLGVLAQCSGELFLEDDAAAHPSRRLPLGCRPAGGDQCLSGRTQCQPQTLPLD